MIYKKLLSTLSILVTTGMISATPVLAPATRLIHKPVTPVRTPDGRVLRNEKDQMFSSNWSGYAVAQYSTGIAYKAATATWVVPSVSSSPTGYSSSWVGIGGDCLDAACSRVDNSLIQLGTEQDTNGYYAWYEVLPQSESPLSTAQYPVNPGDTITATLKVIGANRHYQTWLLTMSNGTRWSNNWSKIINYKSSLASAEWIEEAPYSGGILPLANFGTATFDPGTINMNVSPQFNSGDAIIMQNPNGQASYPSSPDSDTDGFNTCWSSGGVVGCSPPY